MKYLFRNYLQVGEEIIEPVWQPFMDFEHLKKSEPSRIFGNTKRGYMRYKSGQMKYVEALNMQFSCLFIFNLFPFDSHKCCIEYGNMQGDSDNVMLNAVVNYGNKTTRDGPFEVNDLPFPFQIEIESMPASRKINIDSGKTYSYAGMCFRFNRTTRGHLISGYYYPTASFAFLSMISYLIQPDVVCITSMYLFML